MSKWRAQAIRLFPEYRHGTFAFQRKETTIYWIYFELLADLDEKIEEQDRDWLGRVFEYVQWCFNQRNRAPEVWNAAATAFVEHLADKEERAKLIPEYLSVPIFEKMLSEIMKRRDRKGLGKASELLDSYNRLHGTDFSLE